MGKTFTTLGAALRSLPPEATIQAMAGDGDPNFMSPEDYLLSWEPSELGGRVTLHRDGDGTGRIEWPDGETVRFVHEVVAPDLGQLTRTAAMDLAGTAAYLMKTAQLLTVATPEEIHYEREELGRAFRALDGLLNQHYTAALMRAGRLPS